MKYAFAVICALVFVQAPLGLASASPRPELVLTADGLGRFKIGMNMDEVNSHLVHKLVPDKPELRATANCDYLKVDDYNGVAFVFVNNTLERIDVSARGIRSIQGIEVGGSLSAALPKVPGAKREPLDHVPDGAAYVIENPPGSNALSFQFDRDRLVRMIAGDKKVIRYSEGCD